jgi:hypothetical protein
MSIRAFEPHITTRTVERMGGRLPVASGRVGGKVFVSARAYLVGQQNSPDRLRDAMSLALTDLGLVSLPD